MLVRIRADRAKGHSFERIARDMRTTKNVVLAMYHRHKNDVDAEIEIKDALFDAKFNRRKNSVTLPGPSSTPIWKWKSTPPSKKLELLMASGKRGTCLWMDGPSHERKFCAAPASGSWCNQHRAKVFLKWKPSANQVSSISPLRVGRR